MNKYTLDQLAWFDRCLFPNDFAEKLHKVGGMDYDEAKWMKLSLRGMVKNNKKLTIVGIYQEWAVNCPEMQRCLQLVLEDFFKDSTK